MEPLTSPRRHLTEREEDEDHPRRYYGGDAYVPARGGIWLGLGIASIVIAPLGICILPILFGIISLAMGLVALIMGSRDLSRIRSGEMDPQGENLTKAGWILGIIGTVLGALLTLCGVAQIVYFIAIFSGAF
jgi:hypothetical protein